jgi:hypothetical protein
MKRLLMLLATVPLGACATVNSRPCPRVTEFPPDLQRQAEVELRTAPALERMMDSMAADRAANRAVCP